MISLPYPPAKLSPNSRCHWAQKARVFKSYKFQCFAVLSQHRPALWGRDSFELRFLPPDRHRHDLDNALSAFKAGIDALSDVCGVDDSKFNLKIAKGEPTKGGAVVVI
jgi:Holliday junction resolvase RusA-like endonuclease